MHTASITVFLLSLLSFAFVVAGIILYYRSKSGPLLKRAAEGSIPVFFTYILYREVLSFLNISSLFRYETELFAYLGLMAWLYLLNKTTHKDTYRYMRFGLIILAVVFIVFYAIVFSLMIIERIFGLCGFTRSCPMK